eukprot:365983-Chlamydomonas_euryale.AAC.22
MYTSHARAHALTHTARCPPQWYVAPFIQGIRYVHILPAMAPAPVSCELPGDVLRSQPARPAWDRCSRVVVRAGGNPEPSQPTASTSSPDDAARGPQQGESSVPMQPHPAHHAESVQMWRGLRSALCFSHPLSFP